MVLVCNRISEKYKLEFSHYNKKCEFSTIKKITQNENIIIENNLNNFLIHRKYGIWEI